MKDDDFSISDFEDESRLRPAYWVVQWSHDTQLVHGFAYQLCNDTTGILFNDGVKIMSMPGKRYGTLTIFDMYLHFF